MYPVGLTMAPLMPLDGWRAHYGHLLDLVEAAVEGVPGLDLTAELITHRFTPGSKEVLLGWYPRTRLDMDEANRTTKRGKFGSVKYVYPKDVMAEMRGWFTTEPFSGAEVFDFPEGIGPVECVNVEHEEVLLVPRWVSCKRATFKYGLGDEFIDVLRTLHKLGLDSTEPIGVKGQRVAPRDVVAAALPDPATLGDRMTGRTCAGTLVTGTSGLAARTGLGLFGALAVVLYLFLLGAWAIVSVRTARGAASGRLLLPAPCAPVRA